MKFLKGEAVIIGILVLFIGPACSDNPDRIERSDRPESKQIKRTAAACEQGTPVSGSIYVNGSEINFYAGPGMDHAAVINRKATQVLGRTQYRTLWPSMVLEAQCETDEWFKARIVKADGYAVNWEIGWVHKQYVASDASDDMQAGLIWNIDGESEFSDAEKQIVRRGALKVLKDEANCAEITTGYRSGSREGAYYVTCRANNRGPPFNVWFTPGEVEAGTALAVPEPFPETQSRKACVVAIRTLVMDASSLDVRHVLGFATEVHNNGNRTVIQEFSIEDSLGFEIAQRARCLIQPDGSLEITVSEVD